MWWTAWMPRACPRTRARNRPESGEGVTPGNSPGLYLNMKHSRTVALAGLALGAALLLGACGLETYLYLEAPGNYSSGTTLVFQHSTANTDANFLGYEVYYRLYPGKDSSTVPSQATTDISAISAKISAASGADQVIALLKTKGFARMSNQTASLPVTSSGNPPFAPIPSSLTGTAGVRCTIDLGTSLAVITAPSTPDVSYYCARSVLSSDSSHYLPFSNATYDSADCDSSNAGDSAYVASGLMTHPYLVAYALAYDYLFPDPAAYSYPGLLNSSGTATDLTSILVGP